MGEACLAHWFALKVRTGSEVTAAMGLHHRGLESYWPSRSANIRYSDRTIRREIAVFPGYVFCRFAPNAKYQVLETPLVKYIVSFGGQLSSLDDAEMEDIRRIIVAGGQSSPHLTIGQRVRVTSGVLEGIEGILTRRHSEDVLSLSVNLLHRSISIRINSDQVKAV